MGVFIFVRSAKLGFKVKYDGTNRVYVVADNEHANTETLAGLCGNFNGEDEDDFRRSSNEMADNALSFASSWADQDGACELPTNKDACEAHPERKPWATKGMTVGARN